jgi:hypothetical protein
MSPPDREVHRAMQAKLDITERAVNLRRAKAQSLVAMPSDVALYVIAQRSGVPITRWVKDGAVLAQVADFDARLAAKESPGQETPRRSGGSRPSSSTGNGSARGGDFVLDKIRVPAGVLSDRHRRDAEQMATKVYPLLYAFENSAREFIDGHLAAVYGVDWWDDPKLVSKPVRDGVEISRMAEHENRTHSARNARPIYYTTFGDLVLIVQSEKGVKVFKRPLFPRPTWFPELVKASEHSRNIVAHMNPLRKQDLNRLELNFTDWLAQIKGHMPPAIP